MERRIFLSIVGGAGLVGDPSAHNGLLLTALAAEHLPHTAILHNPPPVLPGAIFEVREYDGEPPSPEILARHGIQIIATDRGTLVLSFPDLATRDSCWSSLTADPEWRGAPVDVKSIRL